jgi:hypothetical protein
MDISGIIIENEKLKEYIIILEKELNETKDHLKPDKYINKNNETINSHISHRLPILKKEIDKQIQRIENEQNEELMEIIKIYYDEY